MAKLKKNAPTKECPGCGKSVAAATRTCPHCETVIIKKKKPKAATKKAASKTTTPSKKVDGSDSLDLAIRFVERAGSLKAAKSAIDKIERIKSL